MNRGLLHLLLCLLFVLTSAPAWAIARPENRVWDFSGKPAVFASQENAKPIGTPAENPGCGYDFASGVHKYLYCHGDGINFSDPSGHWEGGLNGLVFNMSMRTAMFAARFGPVIKAARIVIATIAIAGFIADPEFRDIYIASAGNPAVAGEMLAADIRFVSASASGLVARSEKTVQNIITLRFNGGDASDFRVKTARLQRAADAGGLTVVSNPSGIRDPSAQSNYRRAVFVRYTRYLQQLGMNEADATAQATKKFQTLQADHKIDLQVSGALSNPNNSDNLQMLDGTVNMSVGSQLQKEITRLGLQTGDQIDQVNIVGP